MRNVAILLSRAPRCRSIAAPLCLLESLLAVFVSHIQTSESDPDLCQVERDDVFHDRVAPIHGDGKSALEVIACFAEVLDFGVEDSKVVENPGHWLSVASHLEGAEAVGVERGGV